MDKEIPSSEYPGPVCKAATLWQPQMEDGASPDDGFLANLHDERSWAVECILGKGVDDNLALAEQWNPFPIRNKDELDAVEAALSESEDKWEQLVSVHGSPCPIKNPPNKNHFSISSADRIPEYTR